MYLQYDLKYREIICRSFQALQLLLVLLPVRFDVSDHVQVHQLAGETAERIVKTQLVDTCNKKFQRNYGWI